MLFLKKFGFEKAVNVKYSGVENLNLVELNNLYVMQSSRGYWLYISLNTSKEQANTLLKKLRTTYTCQLLVVSDEYVKPSILLDFVEDVAIELYEMNNIQY